MVFPLELKDKFLQIIKKYNIQPLYREVEVKDENGNSKILCEVLDITNVEEYLIKEALKI